ncbi:MAG: hypothetical protein COV35_05435 [Alphaproteobacteria bacterium CG11_big_fil_rev_8_21_14_0_20_39_49]|nr:MAG: hypothetical protein COV35_05435 [Alphaproteobacteria bacterium CG11_big_fil_rev_8_21_14_0_20_39_49]
MHSANISSKLLQELGGGSVIGPILCGLEKSVQILQMGASVPEILNLAAFAAIYSETPAKKIQTKTSSKKRVSA